MRHFKLVNSAGVELDITTTEILFHEISGLGFTEENDFRRVGDIWWLNHTNFTQLPIEGKMLFSEYGGTDPYEKYHEFVRFISKNPLTMLYYPYGTAGYDPYKRTVRVSTLEKTEKNELGVIDSSITFMPYTPWYSVERKEAESIPDDGQGWIWGDGAENPPLIFEPAEGVTARKTKFRGESLPFIRIPCTSTINSPAKLYIYGPLSNPVWTHRVENGGSERIVATGGFSEEVELLENEYLVVDATSGTYAITKYAADGTPSNLYSLRDFGKACFILLREGNNYISVTSGNGELPRSIAIEGYMYNATV